MAGEFNNVYDDALRADAYARLEFPGTYYLAYRDLPGMISEHVAGKRALDFGCGTGRSTRFLKQIGFETVGCDIAHDMLARACAIDRRGDYRLTGDDSLRELDGEAFDLILAVFTFDNIPTAEKKVALLGQLAGLLAPNGRIVNLVSSPEIYVHEWASFTTKDFPENRRAGSGDRVRIIVKDIDDRRPVEDVLWTEGAYRDLYRQVRLEVVGMHKPLAKTSEPYQWISETEIAPWVIYVLKNS